MTRRKGRPIALLIALVLALAPGCRALGEAGADGYSWGNRVFTSNPISVVPFFTGLVLGAVAGLPLALFSAPLTLVAYPSEDREEYFYSAAFISSLGLGTFLGTVLAAPFYPFGLPFLPDDPVVVPGPDK